MLNITNLKTAVKASLKMLPVLMALCFSATAHATLKIYPALANMQGCQFPYTLQVKETGQSTWNTVPLYNVVVTTLAGGTANSTIANFDCDGPIDVKITFTTTVSSAGVFPASLNVTPSYSGNTITFSLSGPKKFYVDINGDHYTGCMHIFANPVEIAPPTQGDPNVIFVPTGTFVDSTISVPSGKTLYIQGGAAVRSVSFSGVSNAKLLGRGFIYRPGFDAMSITYSNNITVDGIIDLNHGWAGSGGCGIRFGQSTNVSISNTGAFSSKKWGDAYDIFCCNGVTIDNVFIRTNDDAITFYGGGKSGYTGDCKNITVTNSTLLPDLAQSFHVGVYGDSYNTEIRDVTCTNIDICNWSRSGGRSPIYFTVGDAVRAANFHFNDIRVQDFVNSPLVLMSLVYNGTYNYGPGRAIDSIYYTNLNYSGANVPYSTISGYDANRKTTNVFFTDLIINGSKIATAANGNIGIGSNTQNIVVTATGTTPAITSAISGTVTKGAAYNYTITATNSPASYAATGLPPGLSLNTGTGVISGTIAAAGTFNIAISATNSSGTGTSVLTLTVAPVGDLVARYAFNNNAIDSSGNGFTATLNGGAVLTANAVNLNGSNGYVSLPKGILNSANDITVATWVKLDTITTWSRIFDMGNNTSVYMYITPKSSTGFPRFTIKNGGAEQIIDGTSALPTGTWIHIAATLSGNTGKLYINGDSVNSNGGITIDPSQMGATTNNYIGHSQYAADPYIKGNIDEFHIYNRPLNSSEIKTMVQNQLLPVTGTATPPVAAVSAISADRQVMLSWASAATATGYNVKRSSVSGGPYTTIKSVTTTTYTDTTVLNGTTYYYVVSAVNINGESANSTEVSATPFLNPGYWPFDEAAGSTATDVWNNRAATLQSGASFAAGNYNNGLSLDGTANGYATLPNDVVSTLNDFTVSVWVKLNAVSTWARAFDFGTGTTKYMFLAPKSGSNYLRYAILAPGSGEQQINSTATIGTGVWTHIAVTLSGNLGIMYVNGIEVGRNAAMTSKPSSLGSTNQNYIGKSQFADPMLNGFIDEFRIYNRALTAAEIAQLKNAATQTVTFNAITQKQAGDSDFDAGATASSNLPVSYTSSNTAVATIVNGKVHINGIGTTTITAAQSGSISYTAAISLNQTLTVVPDPSQYSYWPFDETSGSTATDIWNGHVATLKSGASLVAGNLNNGLKLDGTANGYATLPNDVVGTLNDFTVSVWVKLNAVSMWARAFDFGSGTSKYMFLSPKSGSNYLRYAITTGSYGNEQQINSTVTIGTGIWTHIAVTLSGSLGIMYVNGVEVGRNAAMTLKPSSLGSTNQNYIGKSQFADTMLNGLMDDFRIYNRALTATEIANLKNANTQTITFNAIGQKQAGDSDFDAGATASSNLPVSYTSSNTTVATIVNGKIHINAVGTTTITASQTGGYSYVAATNVSRTLDVVQNGQRVAVITAASLPLSKSSDSEEVARYKVVLYPNPVTGILHIKVSKLEPGARIKIFNAIGIQVLSQRLTQTLQAVSLSKLQPGLYIVYLENGTQITGEKLVKE